MKILLRAQDVWPGMSGSYLIVRDELLKSRPEVVRKLIDITREALKIVKSNEGLVIQASSAELGIDSEIALKSLNKLEWVDEITEINVRFRSVGSYTDSSGRD